ncbi:hypothetical protein O181_039247 [Austropuccinia psidii MF-1]|uniref:Serine/threonine-protein kinase mTOR domain-containing protein n=1 Tax=Austropuccinia psidii MF-1 TaxID=1389203 RepID=A0A9Q3DGE3_9BASI|nr:hypothetical protein [Austropuccinia psidii MF-1]
MLGVLGTLDPSPNNSTIDQMGGSTISISTLSYSTPVLTGPSHLDQIDLSNKDYYPTIAISELLSILQDYSLLHHHHCVQHAVYQKLINKARYTLDTELSTLLGESYSHAYKSVPMLRSCANFGLLIYFNFFTFKAWL